MTVYATIPDADILPEKPIDNDLLTAIRDNPIAITEGSSGAPKIQTAAYDTGSVDQAAMGANSVGQSEVKTTSGIVSLAVASSPSNVTAPGGAYGLGVSAKYTSSTDIDIYLATTITGLNTSTYTYVIGMATFGVSSTVFATQTYINASPPYDLGDGEVPLFVFAKIDDASGEVHSIYTAPDPPWAYNGPTNIAATHTATDGTPMQRRRKRPPTPLGQMPNAQIETWLSTVAADPFEDVVVDQALKQADMPDIPHPFIHSDMTGKSIVLIDPVSDFCHKMSLMHAWGEDVNELLHTGKIIIDNTSVSRATPPGVLAHTAKWKLTS